MAASEEDIAYSTWWCGADVDGSVAVVAVNGVDVSRESGSGTYVWTPTQSGTYELTHTTYANGAAEKVETATFVVTGKSLASILSVAAISAQQQYPWNGLVDIAVTFAGMSNDVVRAECVFAAINTATQAALPITHIQVGAITGMGTTWVRRFVWDAAADIGAVKIADVALTVGGSGIEVGDLGGVQLWENGPYWAECNVGASQIEDSGYYFWWGDTVGYQRNAAGGRLGVSRWQGTGI